MPSSEVTEPRFARPRAGWVGVDIGGTKTAIVVSGTPPAILARREFATAPENGPGPALAQIVAGIRELTAETGCSSIQAIGVSCGSPLDRTRGIIQEPPNLPGWIDVPITSYLGNEFGALCRLENDANAGAVAEFRYGGRTRLSDHDLRHDGNRLRSWHCH